jgi:hypothetical protein
LQGSTEANIARGLLGDLGIAGSLLGGLAGIGNTRIAGDVDCVPGGLTFDECWISRAGFRAKLLQFRLLRVRRCAQSVLETRPFELASCHSGSVNFHSGLSQWSRFSHSTENCRDGSLGAVAICVGI